MKSVWGGVWLPDLCAVWLGRWSLTRLAPPPRWGPVWGWAPAPHTQTHRERARPQSPSTIAPQPGTHIGYIIPSESQMCSQDIHKIILKSHTHITVTYVHVRMYMCGIKGFVWSESTRIPVISSAVHSVSWQFANCLCCTNCCCTDSTLQP